MIFQFSIASIISNRALLNSRMSVNCGNKKDFHVGFGAGTSSSSSSVSMIVALPEHLRNDPSTMERMQTDMAREFERATLITLVEQGVIGLEIARKNGLSEEDLDTLRLREFPDHVTLPAGGGHVLLSNLLAGVMLPYLLAGVSPSLQQIGHVSGAGASSHSSGARPRKTISHWLLDCLRDCSCCTWCSGS